MLYLVAGDYRDSDCQFEPWIACLTSQTPDRHPIVATASFRQMRRWMSTHVNTDLKVAMKTLLDTPTYVQLDTRAFTPMDTQTYTLTYMLPDTQQQQDQPAGNNSRPASLRILPDEDLMILIAQGIIEGPVAELFRRHSRTLYNFVAWSCQGNREESEDICQKTWVKLMRCSDYEPEAQFRTFLFRIARNTLIDVKRSAYEQHEALDESIEQTPEDDLSPERELSLKRNLHRVHKALMDLPVLQREVVVLRFFSDLSMDEIATSIGVGFETVKSRLRYAFVHLRRNLEQAE